MKTLRINLVRDEREFQETGKEVYTVTLANESSIAGFMNAFNMNVEGKTAEKVEKLFETEAEVYAYPDGTPTVQTTFGAPYGLPEPQYKAVWGILFERGNLGESSEWVKSKLANNPDFYSHGGNPDDIQVIPEVYYIVSQIVKSALPERHDLLVPAEVVRDEMGNILGCKSLGR